MLAKLQAEQPDMAATIGLAVERGRRMQLRMEWHLAHPKIEWVAIDDRDRACVGQALELVPVGKQVTWRNPDSRIDYTLRPVRDVDAQCRDYELRANDGSRRSAESLRACRRDSASAWVATRR